MVSSYSNINKIDYQTRLTDAKNFWNSDKTSRRKSMAAIRPSHSVDSNQSYPSMSHSMEFPRAYATLNQKRHSIRHSTSILEDVVSIEHVICLSSDEHESVQKYFSTSYFLLYKNFAHRVF